MFNQMVKYSSKTLDRTFAALADPTRRRILKHLAGGDRCVTDLARPHSMSLPAVSKHLRVLENAGLIRRRRYGRVHQLKLEAKPMQQAVRWIEEYRKFWEGSLDRLADYLETDNQRIAREGNELDAMCPVCIANMALIAAGSASSGGLTRVHADQGF